MKFGMNLLLWTGELNDGMLPVLEQLKKIGYDGVEVPIFDTRPASYADLGQAARRSRLRADRRHDPHRRRQPDLLRRQDPRRRRRSHASARSTAAPPPAASICGPFHSAIGLFSGTGPDAGRMEMGRRKHAGTSPSTPESASVMLGVEYLNRFETYFLTLRADTARFCREVDHPSCRMMYDTFHANIEEKIDPDAIRTPAPTCCATSTSRENDRSTPGQGHVALAAKPSTRCTKIGYDGWMVVEAFGLALPEIAAATKIWRRMFRAKSNSPATPLPS